MNKIALLLVLIVGSQISYAQSSKEKTKAAALAKVESRKKQD